MKKQNKKILYHCSWGGFGHIARAYSVLKYLDADQEALVCSPQDWIFPPLKNVKYQKMYEPGSILTIEENGLGRVDFKGEDDSEGFNKFITQYLDILKEYKPDLVIVDITAEIAILSKLLGYKVISVFETLKTDQLRWMIYWGCSDGILVPYTKTFAEDIDFPFMEKSYFAGGYSRFEGDDKIDRDAARKTLEIQNDEKAFFITMGKARMGEELIIKLVNLLSQYEKNKIYLLYYEMDSWAKKISKDYQNVIIVSGETDLKKYFSASDLVFSGAGYNSMMEIFEFGVPVIFFPLQRIHKEQFNKAKTAAKLGASEYINIEDNEWEVELNAKITRCLDPDYSGKMKAGQSEIVSGNGAKKAAEYIKNV